MKTNIQNTLTIKLLREGFKNPRHGNFPWRELDVCPKDIDVQRWGIRNAFKKRYEECRRYQGPLIANTLEEQF